MDEQDKGFAARFFLAAEEPTNEERIVGAAVGALKDALGAHCQTGACRRTRRPLSDAPQRDEGQMLPLVHELV